MLLSCSSSRLSNGETESVKTMIVHDEGESDAGSTPCKDSTLIVRQVLDEKTTNVNHFPTCSYPQCFSHFVCCVDHFLFEHLSHTLVTQMHSSSALCASTQGQVKNTNTMYIIYLTTNNGLVSACRLAAVVYLLL